MNNEKSNINTTDERWGGYVPWFLRHQDFSGQGNFTRFFEQLSQRLERLFKYNEAGIPNIAYFLSCLETESFQIFRKQINHVNTSLPYEQIADFFSTTSIENETVKRNYDKLKKPKGSTFGIALEIAKDRKLDSWQFHYYNVLRERISVLEALFSILPKEKSETVSLLKRDIKRFFAEAGIMLDIKEDPPLIVPMEAPLLQKGALDNLLPRLASQFPDRAKELVKAYHDTIAGKNLDSVFSEAFKTLEEIARSITGDSSFMFDKPHLSRHFPALHPTIHDTMIKLAGHRGDKGGHARSAPYSHEIRYLLFSICNIALLLLDYPKAPAAD